jgi:hypothetical protein
VDGDQLLTLSRAVDGIEIVKLAPGVQQLIDADAALVCARVTAVPPQCRPSSQSNAC